MSAIVPASGLIRQLDRQAEPEEQVLAEDLADTSRVARLLMSILRDISALKRRWAPSHIDFRDVTVDGTGTTLYQFHHGFTGRVAYWPVEWVGSAAPNLRWSESDTDGTLVLTSTSAGTATIRVEEAG